MSEDKSTTETPRIIAEHFGSEPVSEAALVAALLACRAKASSRDSAAPGRVQ